MTWSWVETWKVKVQGHRVDKCIFHTTTALYRHSLGGVTNRPPFAEVVYMLSMSDDSWLTNKRRGFELYESLLVTGRICPKGSSAGIVFTHGPIFGFFAPQGRLAAQIKVKFGTEERKVRSSVPNFTLIGPGVGGYGPQNWKKIEFDQYNCP